MVMKETQAIMEQFAVYVVIRVVREIRYSSDEIIILGTTLRRNSIVSSVTAE